MVQYQEIEQLAEEYRRVRLENAERRRLLQLLQQARPSHGKVIRWLARVLGRRLVIWGGALQEQHTACPIEASPTLASK